ncbi:hypothetical protein RI196_03725 [Aeribacillus composti]|uniref:Uncharacterized protein n=1 Tax=Aeribacillus composti TaxID=1868734 RepID=A0ABY9WG86_9BACI|nr:hypothetical protein [Aeribacillus composti]WNF33805.1 hypothetical protein RI196_03725 [Aeribacillus composti]
MNVLPQDRKLAEKIWKFGCTCLDKARVEYINSRFDVAEQWVKEFLRCKKDLDELVRRKEEHDRLMEFVSEMQKKGINLALIVRRSYK